MNNLFKFTLACILLIAASVANQVQAQTTRNPIDSLKSVPVEVLAIINKSCAGCHAEPGRIMPLEKLNFSKWNAYTAEKQASKAKAMCEEVSRGKMPPKKFRENNPDAVPTQEELKILCDWVAAMQADK